MRKILKKIILSAITVCAFSGNVLVYGGQMVNMKLFYDGKMHNYSAGEINIKINGQTMGKTDMPPIILGERTLVPARAVFEGMGAEVAWNADAREVYVTKDKDIVVLQIDNKAGSKNGVKFNMDVPAKIINERTVIPLRAVSEALGCNVGWDDKTRMVSISDKGTETPPVTPPVKPPVTPPPVIPEKPIENLISVTGVSVPLSVSNTQNFLVQASGVIEKYENVYVSDNKIVLDIYKAQMKLPNDKMTISTSPFVTNIRAAQHNMNGETVTRVVFDLKASIKYKVTQSSDKKGLVVSFSENMVQGYSAERKNGKDYITIQGSSPLSASITGLNNPKRILIDVPYAVSKLGTDLSVAGLDEVASARTSMVGEKTVRIVLEVKDTTDYKVSQNGNSLTLEISGSTNTGSTDTGSTDTGFTKNNFSYNSVTQTLTLNKVKAFNINQVGHNDNYLMKNYKLTLPGNFEAIYNSGTYAINDSVLRDIQVFLNGNGNTVLSFNEKQVMAYTITEDSGHYYIQVKNPKQVYNKIVVLDAGHGGNDPGTRGNGLVEKEVNLAVAEKVYRRLEQDDNIKVYMTRVDDARPDNAERAKMANNIADLFISIHMNSADSTTVKNPLPNGTETLYTVHSTDVAGKLTSKTVATIMQRHMVSALGTNNRGIKVRNDLLVLNATKVPSIIVEAAFLSNPGDALKMSQEQNQDLAAQAIYDAIVEMTDTYRLR